VLEERGALRRVGEGRLRRVLREHLGGQRIERRGHRRRTRGLRTADETADERLMAEVDPIEDADREVQWTLRPSGEVVKDYSTLRASAAPVVRPMAPVAGAGCAARAAIARRRFGRRTGRASRTSSGTGDATARM
jgi:hypothetical protein